MVNARRLGATVLLFGSNIGKARTRADELAAAQQLTYINGFDDPAIIAGQGTMGLEIATQVPELDAVIVPIGGAGLIAGVALAIKTLKPRAQIIGVEPERAASFSAALKAGHPVHTRMQPNWRMAWPCRRLGRTRLKLSVT